jgi:NAD(P)H-flavin reductase
MTASIDPMVPQAARVARVNRELSDVWTLEIDPGANGFAFAPGQFNMLYAFGIGEAAISISGDPAKPERLIHTIRSVGKVSAALTRLKAGDPVGLRGPYGAGWPSPAAAGADVVIIAGGLGLAPLRPTLYRLFAERGRFGRIVLLCGARSPADILFRKELEHWRTRLDIDVEVTVDRADADWHGNVGVVTTLVSRATFDPAKTVAMVCGPEIMMRFAAQELQRAGVPAEAIYLSMERNMKCAIGHCGHCQFSSDFVCKDGPVATYARLGRLLSVREI